MKPIEQIGHFLGRSWRWTIRARNRLESSLREGGLPSSLAAAISWAVALSILLTVVYFLWWLVVAVVVAVLVARASGRDLLAPLPDPQWRSGVRGVGLYDYEGNRIDTRDQE